MNSAEHVQSGTAIEQISHARAPKPFFNDTRLREGRVEEGGRERRVVPDKAPREDVCAFLFFLAVFFLLVCQYIAVLPRKG